jgi:hypothetical protein
MDHYSALKANVGLLGTKLGDTIRSQLGDAVLERVEQIRQLSKAARQGEELQADKLKQVLQSLTDDELLPVARAFAQFLNLANLAEQPIKDAIPDYGENVNKLVLPAICGVGTVGAVYWLIDDVTGEGAVKLFMLGFAANMIGDLVGDTVKTAMS